MGFGHAVYRTDDPRSLLSATWPAPSADRGRRRPTEARVIALLDALKPGRQLRTNVDYTSIE